jgi:hypothetical protein
LIKKELNTTSFWVNFAVEAAKKAIKPMVMVVLGNLAYQGKKYFDGHLLES